MWQRDPAVVWEDDGDTVWAVHPAVGELVSLNGTGAVIWDWLGTPIDELATHLSEASGAPRDTVVRDVTEYLEKLAEWKLVTHD